MLFKYRYRTSYRKILENIVNQNIQFTLTSKAVVFKRKPVPTIQIILF